MLPEDAIGDLRLDLVHAFTHSNLYECLVDADKVIREVPFVVGQNDIDQDVKLNIKQDDNKPIIKG